ncbi:MAG: hypothetical protein E7668_02725 [Ruminococcaceae bacterium]|nr:hypothetical protein [Oscillospiraceae bacterium]
MARTVLTVRELDARNTFCSSFTALTQAVDAANGAEFEMEGQDDKHLILIQNAATSAKTVTVKAGNGLQGVCDLSCEVAASGYTCVTLESGRFKNVTGDDKGKVILTGTDANIKVAVFKLP